MLQIANDYDHMAERADERAKNSKPAALRMASYPSTHPARPPCEYARAGGADRMLAGRRALNMKGVSNEGLPTLQWPWLGR